MTPQESRPPAEAAVDAVVVGAGFAGMYAHHRLRGLGLSLVGFEAADDVGGTWWWNRYPGARCDIESLDYSYSFSHELEQEWDWSERYATQPEILRYADHVAERFDLRRDIRFGTRVTEANWDEEAQRWTVATDHGDRVEARWLVMAVGCLSASKLPEVPGIETFAGATYHTARWPHEGVDFTGQRVGVIGTGSSGIQSIPIIAEQAERLTVFQRTPNFAVPARNAPLDPERVKDWKEHLDERRAAERASFVGVDASVSHDLSALEATAEERLAAYDEAWDRGLLFALVGSYNDLLIDPDANETAAEYVRSRIRSIVHDPDVAEKLCPRSYPIGTKRLCLDTGYYATFNRPNVTLVDLQATPIEAIEPTGVRTTDQLHELDALVFATGFDAMTGAFLGPEITGVGGQTLREHWSAGPRTYLGLMVAGFPNLFMVTGPGSPSVLTNMIVSIEHHVDWITDCIAEARRREAASVEADLPSEDWWVAHVNELAELSLYPRAASWYMGANVPGKPRVFMPYLGGVALYRQICEGIAFDGYRGFTFGEPAVAIP